MSRSLCYGFIIEEDNNFLLHKQFYPDVFFRIVTLLLEKSDMTSLNKWVEVKADLAGGVPVFKGTRVAVKTLFDYLEEESLEEFLIGFPTVTREQAEGVIEMAAEKFLSGIAE